MTQLQVFNFKNSDVRVVEYAGQPWWVGKDVCDVLGLSDARKTISLLDMDERNIVPVTDSLGRQQDSYIINEPGLYSLILRSRKPEAKEFKRWVTHAVIPAVRKTGMYATSELLDNPDLLIEAATRLKKEREEKQRLQAKIEQDKPKVLFAEALEVSKDSILIADLAKLLKQNDIEIGEIRLFEWLRQNGYLIKTGSERNMPTQRSMDLKIMEIKVGQRMSASEGSKLTRTTKITGKGQIYFINKFKAEAV